MDDKLLKERAKNIIEPWFNYVGSLLVAVSLCEMSIKYDSTVLTISAIISIILSCFWTILNGCLLIKKVFPSGPSKDTNSQETGRDIVTFALLMITTAGAATVIMLISKLIFA